MLIILKFMLITLLVYADKPVVCLTQVQQQRIRLL
jgi:hypothetical protein